MYIQANMHTLVVVAVPRPNSMYILYIWTLELFTKRVPRKCYLLRNVAKGLFSFCNFFAKKRGKHARNYKKIFSIKTLQFIHRLIISQEKLCLPIPPLPKKIIIHFSFRDFFVLMDKNKIYLNIYCTVHVYKTLNIEIRCKLGLA